MKIWTNINMALFRVGDPPEFMTFQIGIAEISWFHLESATVHLTGLLPRGLKLLDIRNGDTFEIVCRNYRAPEDYDYNVSEVAFRLTNCEVAKKWIENIIPLNEVGYGNQVILHLMLDCHLEVNSES